MTTIPNGRCDPQGAGCKALSEVKSSLREERGKHIAPLYQKLDGKADKDDVKELANRIWIVITLQIAALGSFAVGAIILYLKG